MLAGHVAAGMVAKRIEPRISLGTAVFAALLADVLCFVFLIAGIERFNAVRGNGLIGAIGDIPYSHSLLMDSVWGALFAAVYFARTHNHRGALVLFAAVLSHWLLDFVSHSPDMRIAPGSHRAFGLGLWNSMPASLIVEGGFWLIAIVLYVRATKPKNRAGVYALWIGVALITLVWHGNIRAGIDPDQVRAGIGGLIFFSLIVAWAYWMNRLRPAQ